MGVLDRVKRAWNTFTSNDSSNDPPVNVGAPTYGSSRPDRPRHRFLNERTILASILVRMAVDVSGVSLKHAKISPTGRYIEDKDSHLNSALTVESNLDQAPRAFRQDIAMTLFDDGVAAIVPVDAIRDTDTGGISDILTLRVGKIVAWAPRHVLVSLYNEKRGVRQELWLEKQYVAIVENPFYAVMNQSNSTLQRLIRKLNLLDVIDERSATGKLDLIIQLPYTIKSDTKRQDAERRRNDIEDQLTGSTYGIAYADSTEKIVQLNRPVENNMLAQVEFLTKMLYGQMGVTEEIMNGTAGEKEMLNYFDRTVEPVVDAIREAMRRSFVGSTKTETIMYFRNPFKLVPLSELADVVDKLARNEVLSSNEIRGYMGIPPADDPKADLLINSNMPVDKTGVTQPTEADQSVQLQREGQNGV